MLAHRSSHDKGGSNMKIICFTESLAAGGAQRQLVNLAVLFKRRGHDVEFLVYRHEDFFLPYLSTAKVPVHYMESNTNIGRLIKCRRFINRSRVDIVLSFLETPGFIACFSALGFRRWKNVTTELSAKPQTFMGRRSKLFLWFQHFSDSIVCNSLNAEKMWKEHCPQYASKISTIYNPVLLSISDDDNNVNGSCKRKIIVPASYQFLKNPIRLIEAVNSLPLTIQRQIEIEWYGKIEPTRGNTAAYDEALALVQKYELDQCIQLNQETMDIYERMSKADAIGLFSTVEGMPNAICEGMMFGKPIIMTKVSDYEVFAQSHGVFLCESESIDSIKEALIRFHATSQEELKAMGRRNKELGIKLFDGDAIAAQWEELFTALR